MKCFECDKTVEIKTIRAFPYKSISLDNIVLLNVKVEVCSYCGTETPLLKNLRSLHNEIGIALALQKNKLSGAELRFLRRIAGLKTDEWAERIGLAEGSYNRLEGGGRPITPQVDKLARINFLSELSVKVPQSFNSEYLDTILALNIETRHNIVIAVDAEYPEKSAKYLSPDSPILAKPVTSYVRVATALYGEVWATVNSINDRHDWEHLKNNSQLAMCA